MRTRTAARRRRTTPTPLEAMSSLGWRAHPLPVSLDEAVARGYGTLGRTRLVCDSCGQTSDIQRRTYATADHCRVRTTRRFPMNGIRALTTTVSSETSKDRIVMPRFRSRVCVYSSICTHPSSSVSTRPSTMTGCPKTHTFMMACLVCGTSTVTDAPSVSPVKRAGPVIISTRIAYILFKKRVFFFKTVGTVDRRPWGPFDDFSSNALP